MTLAVDFDTTRVSDAISDVLAAIGAAADELTVDLPARQITAPGAVPYDCEEVVVFGTQLTTGAPESRSGALTYPNPDANATMYQLVVSAAIVRKTKEMATSGTGTGVSAPPAAAYTANMVASSADAAVLIRAAQRLVERWSVTTGAVPHVLTLNPPQGGLSSVTARYTLVI